MKRKTQRALASVIIGLLVLSILAGLVAPFIA